MGSLTAFEQSFNEVYSFSLLFVGIPTALCIRSIKNNVRTWFKDPGPMSPNY